MSHVFLALSHVFMKVNHVFLALGHVFLADILEHVSDSPIPSSYGISSSFITALIVLRVPVKCELYIHTTLTDREMVYRTLYVTFSL